MVRLGVIATFFPVIFLWVGQANPFPIESVDVDLLHKYFSKNILSSSKRALTPEEKDLVERTRAHLAEVLQKNLMRLLGVYMRGEDRGRQDDDDEDEEGVNINPNTLPQVAALLGAIFSGNLNLTSVVDKAFFLVPDAVRAQVSGIVKLISGQPAEEPLAATTTTTAIPLLFSTTTPPPEVKNSTTETSVAVPVPTTKKSFRIQTTKTPRRTYPNAPDIAVPPRDVRELDHGDAGRSGLSLEDLEHSDRKLTEEEAVAVVEKEIKSDPKLYEAYVKSPRYFLEPLRKIFKSNELNLTTVYQVMPDLFKGARQTFVLLESLGQIAGIGGGGGDDNDE